MTRWQPSPFLRLCLVLHLLALGLFVARPALWPWLIGALIALHAVIASAGLLPRCRLLGRNLTRLPAAAIARGEIALTLDDGPDPEVTPQVLAILRRYGARATFFCIGEQAARYPELCRQMVQEGHAIENHGQRHRTFTAFSGLAGWRREIGEGQATLEALTGQRPRFYRAVAGLRNPFLDPCLHRAGLFLASWTRRGYDTRDKNPKAVYAKLARHLRAGDILLLHDGNAARDLNGQPVILDVLPRILDTLAERQLKPVTLRQAYEDRP
ncbi:MAG: polysaccharide deacetylase family protein [Paludibacterium sp.]|uniref:polysaccharide deacetylase family protein n=1 Tax=Paludibacterium sp. TaxID=1917523 RepID=UPI0025FE1550|nr:polysaccharide deacetylase family protein [Paludibacterium sp.]MBV8047873.1 polysaccharide deacetylase family protein [Paludibacterium sp.]MBV8649748.1 polysaccharide deacetylase family protein [Paludibacterium sp.]